jgi:hypothetical protein
MDGDSNFAGEWKEAKTGRLLGKNAGNRAAHCGRRPAQTNAWRVHGKVRIQPMVRFTGTDKDAIVFEKGPPPCDPLDGVVYLAEARVKLLALRLARTNSGFV